MRKWLAFVALVVLGGILLVANEDQYVDYYRADETVSTLLTLVQSAALVGALFFPIPAWLVSTFIGLVAALSPEAGASGTAFPWTPGGLAVQAGVLFLVAYRARPRTTVEVFVVSLLAGVAVAIPSGQYGDLPFAVPVFATAAVVGASLRGRRVARAQLVQQRERTAEEHARRAVLEERGQIARELHDVVAHQLSLISIQAQAAPHLAENPSEELKQSLASIRENAVDGLTELRRVLGVLRSEDGPDDRTPHRPQPGLDQMEELLGSVRSAGLTVSTEITGDARSLPPGVELSAFRIVQEALSNAIRHAPGADVRVAIEYHQTALTIRVVNTAPARPIEPPEQTGHGQLGMRERVAMLGGDLATGVTPDGGYEVSAILPTEHPSANEDTA